MGSSNTETEGLRVQVVSEFVEQRSDPARGVYFFAYRVLLTNQGDRPARLVSRHWVITDGNGKVENVRGPGVVGKHPDLGPGDSFEYVSFCPLPTPIGSMRGSYQMVRDDGSAFDAEIGEFALEVPGLLN